jgi:HK97 family phage major capsid protein/HK97 family phage prohead protease
MDRAYSLVTVKTVDEEQRLIVGLASTPEVDRMGDVVEPNGAKFADSIPLLLHHDSRLPVGSVRLKRGADGISFQARLPKVDEPGNLKNRVDEAWQSVKAGLIKGVSIGFRALEDGVELMKSGGLRFTGFEILELSLVAVPANASASIQSIKSLDQSAQAASGIASAVIPTTPAGVTALPVVKTRRERTVKTISEQIADYKANLAAKSGRMTEIMQKSSDEGVTLDQAQSDEYDGLESEVNALNAHIARLGKLEASNKAAAVEVKGATMVDASASRQSIPQITVRDNTPPGIAMARVVIAKMAAFQEARRGNYVSAVELAQKHYAHDPRVVNYLKTAVAGGLTTDTNWATELVEPVTMDFIEYLRNQTILGKLNLQRRPFNIRTPRQTTGGAGYWVGEGKPKPLTKFHFDAVTLPYTKVAAISVITQELARFSNPSAEAIVRDQLAKACQERLDTDLIDPDKAVSSGVNPASLTNGVTALTSSGTAAANVVTDIQNLIEQFILNRQDVSGLVLIMPNTLALAASLMLNTTLSSPVFPGLSMNGGNLLGIPVITSQYAASGASYGNMIIAIDQNAVALADDGGFTVDVSTEASLQMDDAPDNSAATGTGQSLVSMFQTNSIAIRAERMIHWVKLRSTAVSYMDDVNWGSIGSPV